MTNKKQIKWDSINWGNVIKGVSIALAGLGFVGGSMATYASSEVSITQVDMIAKDLVLHSSLDSMRWIQMERRIVALEIMTSTISNNVKESNEILKREFNRSFE